MIDPSGWISEYLVSADFSPDGEVLAIGSNQGVELWSVRDGTKLLGLPRQVATDRVHFGRERLYVANAYRMMTWSVSGGAAKERSRWARPCEPDDKVFAMAVSPDASLVAIGCEAGLVRLGDPNHEKPSFDLQGHTELVRELAFVGPNLVSVSDDGSMRVWDLKGRPVRTIQPSLGRLLTLAALGDKQVVVGGTTPELKLFDVETGEALRTFAHSSEPNDWPRSLDASGDGTWFISTWRGLLDIWETSTGRRVVQHRDIEGEQAVLSPNGKLCAWMSRKRVDLYRLPKPH